jgi:spore coat polysaccharide biosynthesis protein SpsF
MADKVVIIVQTRMASTRLPGKVMMPVLGKSMLARMIERLLIIRHRATIVIATSENADDDVIVEEAKQLKVPYYRGSFDNVLERHYQAAKLFEADVVLKIPSDCPLIDPRIVDEVLDYFFNNRGKYDYVSNLHPATWPDGNDVEIMTMNCLQKAWDGATRPLEMEHTTPFIWEELYRTRDNFSCQDILDLLQRKPEIYELNAQYAGVNWYRNHLGELKTIASEQTRQAPLQTV